MIELQSVPEPGSRQPAAAERRALYALDPRARRLFLATAALAATLCALFGVLAVLLARAAPVAAAAGQSPLFVAIAAVSFALVAAALALAVHSALTLHRVLGAAYHIREHLRVLGAAASGASSAPPPLVLRPDDALADVAAAVNAIPLARWKASPAPAAASEPADAVGAGRA